MTESRNVLVLADDPLRAADADPEVKVIVIRGAGKCFCAGYDLAQHPGAYPVAELEERVLEMAGRVAKLPADLLALNKRTVHRAMEAMGIRTGIRATTELQVVGLHQQSSREYIAKLRQGVTRAVQERDQPFGDYRTRKR